MEALKSFIFLGWNSTCDNSDVITHATRNTNAAIHTLWSYLIHKAVVFKCQTWNGTHVNPGILITLLNSFLVLHLNERKQKTYLFYITLFDSHRPEEEDSIQIFPNVTIPFSITLPFRSHTPDFYVPVFTLAEMFCYMGKIRILPKLILEQK